MVVGDGGGGRVKEGEYFGIAKSVGLGIKIHCTCAPFEKSKLELFILHVLDLKK